MAENPVLDRVRKLLRMTEENGCSAGEAANALRLANDLMTEHNIAMSDAQEIEGDITEGRLSDGFEYNKPSDWAVRIADALSQLWGLTVLTGSRGKRICSITFIGRDVDVAVASESYRWLVAQAKTLLQESWRASSKRTAFRAFEFSFLEGYAQGISYQAGQLIREREQAESKVGAIIALKDADNQAFLNQKYPEIKERAQKENQYTDFGAFLDGSLKGESASLSKLEAVGQRVEGAAEE